MLSEWQSHSTKGEPIFIKDGSLLTIINDPNERGVWSAEAPVNPGDKLLFYGTWSGSGTINVRLIWFDLVDELDSILQNSDPIPTLLVVPADATHVRVNCILSGEGTAVFDNIELVPESVEEEFLPVPPPDMAQKHHVTGWKWGRNIALLVHDSVQIVDEEAQACADPMPPADLNPEQIVYNQEPPDYGIPYAVSGWQHGRNLDLQIGNMYLDPDPDPDSELVEEEEEG